MFGFKARSNKAKSPFTGMLIFFYLPFLSGNIARLSCPTDEHDYDVCHYAWNMGEGINHGVHFTEFIHSMDDTISIDDYIQTKDEESKDLIMG